MADRVGVRTATGTHGDLSAGLFGDGLHQAPVLVAEHR